MGGSGLYGFIRSLRSFWYQIRNGSGKIGNLVVAVAVWQWLKTNQSGSGWVAVGYMDVEWQCGHFGTKN
jgi:hypothetical protein